MRQNKKIQKVEQLNNQSVECQYNTIESNINIYLDLYFYFVSTTKVNFRSQVKKSKRTVKYEFFWRISKKVGAIGIIKINMFCVYCLFECNY